MNELRESRENFNGMDKMSNEPDVGIQTPELNKGKLSDLKQA